MNKEYDYIEIPDYEKLYTGSPNEQLGISRLFSSNMKILEKTILIYPPCVVHVTRVIILCLQFIQNNLCKLKWK